jgi:hypothetical protein
MRSQGPVTRQFFWRNKRINLGRARDIWQKMQERGFLWIWQRLGQELRVPETVEGIYIRALAVRVYGLIVVVLSPLLFLTEQLLSGRAKTLYFFYDLDVSPVTYDMADYLVLAELERRRRGLHWVYVYVVPGRSQGFRDEDPDYEKIVDKSNRVWRLNNLVIPLFALLPTCAGYSICRNRRQAALLRLWAGRNVYPPTYWPVFPVALFRRPLFEAARQGVEVFPMFKAPERGVKYVQRWLGARVGERKAITITLREYGADPMRNSNIRAWAVFAHSLNPEAFIPIFVFDTETAMDPVPDVIQEFLVFPEASWNLALRSALYELAYLNLAVVHGPTELLWYNHRCRYILFFPRADSSQTGADYVRANGFIHGESLPFAAAFQKWVWEQDEADVIQREFNQMSAAIEGPLPRPEEAERLERRPTRAGTIKDLT